MAFLHSSWRFLATLAVLCLLPLGLGCGGKKDAAASTETPSIKVSGTVTYIRKPLAVGADGIPTGLKTDTADFVSLPLRGVAVRAFQGKVETDASGNSVTVWKVVNSTNTTAEGKYSLSVAPGVSTFIEVASSMSPLSGSSVRVMASSISDPTPLAERPFYVLRKAADGTSPAGDQTPSSTPTADATVDFAIGLAQPWWVGPTSTRIEKTVTTAVPPVTTWLPSLTQESTGTGSRVAAILDTVYTFGSTIGDPTPGKMLSLHYDVTSADSGPSFVEYDLEAYTPTKTSNTYFGYLRASSSNDDAWDEGVILSLLARNHMVSQRLTSLTPTTPLADRSDLQDLRPDMALLEGFSDAIAAILLKSPYLADTSAGGTVNRDIRLTAGLGSDVYSAAKVASIAWKLNLYANGTNSGGVLTPVTDTFTGWATLSQTALRRFFAVVPPVEATTSLPADIGSLYSQLARLKEARGTADTVDLAAFFTDANLKAILEPDILWPRPTSTATLPDPLVPEAGFLANWGTDPNSTVKVLPSFSLKMQGIAHLNRLNVYPNFSKGEVYLAQFTCTKDRNYRLTVQGLPALPAGASLEVRVDGTKACTFTASGSQDLQTITGPVPPATTAVLHRLQFRLISPDTLLADQNITVRLDPR